MPTVCGIYARQRPTPPCKGSSRSRPEPSRVLSPCAHKGLWGRVRGKNGGNKGTAGETERGQEQEKGGKEREDSARFRVRHLGQMTLRITSHFFAFRIPIKFEPGRDTSKTVQVSCAINYMGCLSFCGALGLPGEPPPPPCLPNGAKASF